MTHPSTLFQWPRLASRRWIFVVLLSSSLPVADRLGAQSVVPPTFVPQAPPAPPPAEWRPVAPSAAGPHAPKGGPMLYSIGQPTDDEQEYLELINRSRANPPAEGVRLATTTDPNVLAAYAAYSVDTNQLVLQFNALSAVPPLAFNSNLIASARGHSWWMLTNNIQCHYEDIPLGCPTSGSPTNTPGYRATQAGYVWQTIAENIFASSLSDWYGHAGFNVDWGLGPYGMQSPPGHRQNIANPNYREIGVGVLAGTNTHVGPQLVTEDFGAQFNPVPFVTGVAYYDLNGNGFYDAGEGIGGVTVNVSGSAYYAVTSESGGYAVPAANGSVTVTFSGPGLPTAQTMITIANDLNVKVDYTPAYQPPVISGPLHPAVNGGNLYNFTPVGGAVGYQWRSVQRTPYATTEGAENGLGNVTLDVSPGYSVLDSNVKRSGSYSFHLAQPTAVAQYLGLNPTLRAGTNAALQFATRLAYSGNGQVARAQISTNAGADWLDVWSQTGTNGPGEPAFTLRSISLAAYAGQQFSARFVYDFVGGSYYPQTDDTPPNPPVGFYLDDISFANVEQVTGDTTNSVPGGTSFVFTPGTPANYSLWVRPQLAGHLLDFGPEFFVTAIVAPILTINQVTLPTLDQVQIDFGATNVAPASSFLLLDAVALAGPWGTNTAAVLTTNVPGAVYRFRTPAVGATRFYRVKAP